MRVELTGLHDDINEDLEWSVAASTRRKPDNTGIQAGTNVSEL